MPLIRMETSVTISETDETALALALSKIAATAIGKPESYVMSVVSRSAISMAGEMGPAAFLDVRSIGGLNQSVNRDISKQVAALLKEKLQIPDDRIYISFESVSGVNWGYQGSTFG